MESGSSVAYGGLPAKGAIVNERNVVKKSEKDGNKSQDGHCCVAIQSSLCSTIPTPSNSGLHKLIILINIFRASRRVSP